MLCTGGANVSPTNAIRVTFGSGGAGSLFLSSTGMTLYPGYSPGAGGFGATDIVVGSSGAQNATTDTSKFLYITSAPGTPTGVPAQAAVGRIPITADTVANKLWMYVNGAWREPSAAALAGYLPLATGGTVAGATTFSATATFNGIVSSTAGIAVTNGLLHLFAPLSTSAPTLTIENTGTISTASPQIVLNHALNANQQNFIFAQVGGMSRWDLRIGDNTTESGGGTNSGSNFQMRRYDDSGAGLGTVLTILRSNGQATFGNDLLVQGTFTGVGPTILGALATQAPALKSGTAYTLAATDFSLLLNPSATFTLTLPSPTGVNQGRLLFLKLVAAFAVNSASSNIVQLAGGAATAAIMAATAGKFCVLQSDGANWQIMQAN